MTRITPSPGAPILVTPCSCFAEQLAVHGSVEGRRHVVHYKPSWNSLHLHASRAWSTQAPEQRTTLCAHHRAPSLRRGHVMLERRCSGAATACARGAPCGGAAAPIPIRLLRTRAVLPSRYSRYENPRTCTSIAAAVNCAQCVVRCLIRGVVVEGHPVWHCTDHLSVV